MSNLHALLMTIRGKDGMQHALELPVASNIDFLKEVARRALRLEETRANARAQEISAVDYADHEIRFGNPVESSLKVVKVYFNCTAGHYHEPYVVMETRVGVAVYGHIAIGILQKIREVQPNEFAITEVAL